MTKFGVLYTNNLINPLLKVNLWHVFTEISKPEISPLGLSIIKSTKLASKRSACIFLTREKFQRQ